MAGGIVRVIRALEDVRLRSITTDIVTAGSILRNAGEKSAAAITDALSNIPKHSISTNTLDDFVTSFKEIVDNSSNEFVEIAGTGKFKATVKLSDDTSVPLASIIDDIKLADLTRYAKALAKITGQTLDDTVRTSIERTLSELYPLGRVVRHQQLVDDIVKNTKIGSRLESLAAPSSAAELNKLIEENAVVKKLMDNVSDHLIKKYNIPKGVRRNFASKGLVYTVIVTIGIGMTANAVDTGAKKASGYYKYFSCSSGIQGCRVQTASCDSRDIESTTPCKYIPPSVAQSTLCSVPMWPDDHKDVPEGTPGRSCRKWDVHAPKDTLQYLSPEEAVTMYAECEGSVDTEKLAVVRCVPKPTLASYFADIFSKLPKAIFNDISDGVSTVMHIIKYAVVIVVFIIACLLGYRAITIVKSGVSEEPDEEKHPLYPHHHPPPPYKEL